MEVKYDIALIVLPDRISNNPEMYFPLGVAYLASVVRNAGYKVTVCDFRRDIGEIPKAIYYGFSCATPQIEEAKLLAKQLDGITIAGGAHPTLLPDDCINHFDYVVAGEGESIILDILEGKVKNGLITTKRIEDLDTIPYPAWDMITKPFSDTLWPGERYGRGDLAGTLIGSRGCMFNCQFCGNLYRKPVIFRSVSDIIGELESVMKFGVYHFRFEDDNFTEHPEYKLLCKEIKKLDIRYKCHTRSNLLTEDKARLLKESGCEECGLGVESADDKVLRIVHKGEKAVHHGEAIRKLRQAGIRSKTYFMSGLPGETDNTLSLNMEFMQTYKPDKWTISTFSPYPGCGIFKHPEQFGIEIIEHDWRKWGNFCNDQYNHVLMGQTPEEMWNRYKKMYAYYRSNKWQA